jgi:SRSO17 transposase
MRWSYHQLVRDDLGDPEGVLRFDKSGFPTKGQDAVGVARQYCGTLGKVEHCQGGVCAAYASRHGDAFLDKRLFLPDLGFTDAYATRRTLCQAPPEITLQTTPQLAVAMLLTRRAEGLLPFKDVVT